MSDKEELSALGFQLFHNAKLRGSFYNSVTADVGLAER